MMSTFSAQSSSPPLRPINSRSWDKLAVWRDFLRMLLLLGLCLERRPEVAVLEGVLPNFVN